jgi:hypothetical protein
MKLLEIFLQRVERIADEDDEHAKMVRNMLEDLCIKMDKK